MYISIDSIKYHIQLRDEGIPIICLHGFSENVSTWDLLLIKGFQLVMIDLIGHGESDKPTQKKYYRLSYVINAIHEIVKALGFKRYCVLGYSMGGRIALAYALKYQNEIIKLILESSSYGECGYINKKARRKYEIGLADKICRNGILWFTGYWSNQVIFESQKKLNLTLTSKISGRRLLNLPHALSNTLLCLGQGILPCYRKSISALKIPILYISGKLDKKYMLMGDTIRKLNNFVTNITIEGCGHNTHIEASEKFNQILTKFL